MRMLQVEHLGGHGSSPGNGSLNQCGKRGDDGNGHDGNSIRILRSQPTERGDGLYLESRRKDNFKDDFSISNFYNQMFYNAPPLFLT